MKMQENEKNIKKIGKNAIFVKKTVEISLERPVITLNACFDQDVSFVWILRSK